MLIPEKPLAGYAVVLVQAAPSATARVAELRALGADCLNLPVLATRWLDGTAARLDALRQAQLADYLVFASPIAVAGCFLLMPNFWPQGVVYAQGPATQSALAAAGVAARLPANGFTSEDLLNEAEWREPRGRQVVRIAGQGGRELLLASLAARGAVTAAVAVYRRVTRPLSHARLQALGRLPRPLLVITSAEAVRALAQRLPAAAWQRLQRGPWLVSSPRLAELAAHSGCSRVLLARSAAWVDLRATIQTLAAERGADC